VVEGVKLVRRIERKVNDITLTGSFAELYPGNEYTADLTEDEPDHYDFAGNPIDTNDDAGLEQFVRSQAWGHHACGTARIGRQSEGAVLDGHFKVYGTSGLRVVDASVFPEIPGFFIVTSVYMIGEKAAQDILNGTTPPYEPGGSVGPDPDGTLVETEPNDAIDATASALVLPSAIRAEIGAGGDVDVFPFTIYGPTRVVAETTLVPQGSASTDTVVEILAPDGSPLGEDDDGGEDRFSRLEQTLSQAGTYFVRVRGYDASVTGPYLLRIGGDALVD